MLPYPNRKKVAFLELLHHHECVELPYLALQKSENFDVRMIIGEFVFNNLKKIPDSEDICVIKQKFRQEWVSQNGLTKIASIPIEFSEISMNVIEAIKIIKKEKPDFLYVNTIISPYLLPLIIWLSVIKHIKVIYVLHSTDILFKGIHVDNKIKKYTGLILNHLFRAASGFVMLGEYIRVPDKYQHIPRIVINNRPLAASRTSSKGNVIKFVVSGSVDPKLRDYESVFRGFSNLLMKNEHYRDKVQLVILSKLDNRNVILTMIERYELTAITKHYDQFVSEQEFDTQMGSSHFSIIPTYAGSEYGDYKISGAFGDAVAYGHPILLSEHYAKDYDFGPNIIRFGSTNLDEVLLDILQKDYTKFAKTALEESEKYSVDNVSEKLKKLLK